MFDKSSHIVVLLTTIPVFYNLIPNFTVSVTSVFFKQWCLTQETLR